MDDYLWKLYPFHQGNRVWAVRLFQGYGLSLLVSAIMAVLLNAVEGDRWKSNDHGQKVKAVGKSSLDECLWFTFTTLHGVGFGEFLPESTPGDWLTSVVVAVSYWCAIFMSAIVMLSQLPGVKPQSLFSMVSQMAYVVWPSYLVFVSLTVCFGFIVGPYIMDGLSADPSCNGPCEKRFNAVGIQWLWSVMHRAPFGDVWPDTPFGRSVTIPAAVISYLYPPYVLALIAIRRPTPTEHAQLLAHMNAYPEEAMGPGYIVPPSGPRDVQLSSAPLTNDE
jgi:hypothetical protein